MQWLWIGLGVVGGAVAVIAIWGAVLPRNHKCLVTGTYRASPERVWALITGVEDFSRWRKDVTSVKIRERDAQGAPVAWTERSRHGPIPLRTVEQEPPVRLVGKIDSDTLPYGGRWIYELEALGDKQVRLSITEDGEVKNVLFRFLSRFVFGHDTTLKTYHQHLAAEIDG